MWAQDAQAAMHCFCVSVMERVVCCMDTSSFLFIEKSLKFDKRVPSFQFFTECHEHPCAVASEIAVGVSLLPGEPCFLSIGRILHLRVKRSPHSRIVKL